MANLTFNTVENASLSKETIALVNECASPKNVSIRASITQPGITALYERLSSEDNLDGESNSIANQKKILERYCEDKGYNNIVHYDEDMYNQRLIQCPTCGSAGKWLKQRLSADWDGLPKAFFFYALERRLNCESHLNPLRSQNKNV